MALTEMSVRKAAPREKTCQLICRGVLALWVYPSGAKSWRLRYWENGKEKKRALGEYPVFSLKEACEGRDGLENLLLSARRRLPTRSRYRRISGRGLKSGGWII